MNVAFAALEGLQRASEAALGAAQRISRPADGGAGGDVVDLSAEAVALIQAKNLTSAMVSVAQTADEMDAHILNLLG